MLELFDTVDGRNPAPVDMDNIPLFTTGFIHPKWLFGISSIDKYLALFEGFIFFEHILCHWKSEAWKYGSFVG